MICANCSKKIAETEITEDGYFFCNTLCRYEWRQKGKPNPYSSSVEEEIEKSPADIDLDFPIEILGFENRYMMIRVRYFFGPKLFLDGKEVVPVKKSFFTKNREYLVTSNFGKPVKLKLAHKFLDLVPKIKIDGQTIEIARPLNTWEYIWMCIPLIICFSGGMIGGFIGSVATYSNSILMRKAKNVFVRYLFTGVTTLLSFLLFLKIVGFIVPVFLPFRSDASIEKEIKKFSVEINQKCPLLIDTETRLDSVSPGVGREIKYFYTLVNIVKIGVDSTSAKDFLTAQIINNIKTNDQMRFMRDAEITMIYSYYDKNSDYVFQIKATKDDYQ